MNKNYIKETLERETFQITIANLTNSDKPQVDRDIIELNDVEMSFELFRNCFYNNNYKYFELNSQFNDLEELLLFNKTIKYSNFKSIQNYKNGNKINLINLIDIMNYKYIKNKKTKVSDSTKISLIKDISTFDSLLDFNIYNNHLSLNNVLDIFNQQVNKQYKKYFRFKIKTTYYSVDLDETLSICFNYLVKIPKSIDDKNTDLHEDINEVIVNEVIVEESKKSEKPEKPEVKAASNKVNIVYSNYRKKSDNQNKINLLSSVVINPHEIQENISELGEDSDVESESNITTSSFGINESDDPFF
jgi:hypothetical protein